MHANFSLPNFRALSDDYLNGVLTDAINKAPIFGSIRRTYMYSPLRFFWGKYHMRLACHWFGHIQSDRNMVILDVGIDLASN